MTMGTSTQAYGEPWYWDNRYANESGPFDWYQKYASLAPLVNLYTPRHNHPRILVVGCGNSGALHYLFASVGDGTFESWPHLLASPLSFQFLKILFLFYLIYFLHLSASSFLCRTPRVMPFGSDFVYLDG